MIDTNVYLSRWPFRRLPLDTTEELAGYLRRHDVRQAWAGSFEGLLHRDLTSVNRRLAVACKKHGKGILVPVGSINPTLPDWQGDLDLCLNELQMKAIRLHPNYHGYKLDDARFLKLMEQAQQHRLIIQIALKMEDERTQHPLLQVPTVDPEPLEKVTARFSKSPIVLLNAMRSVRPDQADRLATAGPVYFETSMIEGVGGIEKLIKSLPVDRLLFGSYAPFFYFKSAQLKLKESSLPFAIRQAIVSGNVEKLQRHAPK